MAITNDGLLLQEIRPGVTVEEVQRLTEPELIIGGELQAMQF
jgi:acyl CoA:acetate/3-ketoacid CoA transferase beta subunit